MIPSGDSFTNAAKKVKSEVAESDPGGLADRGFRAGELPLELEQMSKAAVDRHARPALGCSWP